MISVFPGWGDEMLVTDFYLHQPEKRYKMLLETGPTWSSKAGDNFWVETSPNSDVGREHPAKVGNTFGR